MEEPKTVAEASGWRRTSTSEQVRDYLGQLSELPGAARLESWTFGKSFEDRDLVVVRVNPESQDSGVRPRVLVNANIHAGEVEGKEAVLQLLREIVHGRHADVLAKIDLWFVPVYNPDGNDRIDRKNRVSQNGPEEGVGTRANAQDLDLNRDFIKLEAPEARALLGLMKELDPHVFVDLHTTNGSYHGYHLTYSPSLSTNVDEAIDSFARGRLLPDIRRRTEADHGFRTFDYGNFTGGGFGEGESLPSWDTYDHRPRFGTNYNGLRNRFSVLSEAYSHLDFETRVRVTRGFVLAVLGSVAEHSEEILAACAAADAHLLDEREPASFRFDSGLAEGAKATVLKGAVETLDLGDDLGARVIALPEYETFELLVRDAFESARALELPAAWAVRNPSGAVLENLAAHGVTSKILAEDLRVKAERFVPSAAAKAKQPFQGHREVTLKGEWKEDEVSLAAGTCVVPGRQRLGRVAAQLLEPQSEDSLTTWNFFEEDTRVTTADAGGDHPVVRLGAEAWSRIGEGAGR